MKLRVMMAGRPCGELEIDRAERFSFRYLPEYLADDGLPLSVSMPLSDRPWPDSVAFPWFENLLPEGELRFRIAEDLRTDVQNISRLLSRLGGDVAGAMSLLPEDGGQEEGDSGAPSVFSLEESALGGLLDEAARHPFLAARPIGPRLSLAGAQQKLPVVIGPEGVGLPGRRPSTHLLKPPAPRFVALPHNEFACMRAAGIAGLDVPEVALRDYRRPDGSLATCLQVTRYDRREDKSGAWVRLHQEDLCQALSVVSPRKYELDGGPGMSELFAVVRQYSAAPARDIVELIKRVLFNLLIGNEDAHGKNFSLLYARRKPVLAPAYDLLSTAVYPELSRDLAMRFGGARRFDDIGKSHMQAFAEATGTAPARMKKALLDFLDRAMRALERVVDEQDGRCTRDEVAVLAMLIEQSRQRHRVLVDVLGN